MREANVRVVAIGIGSMDAAKEFAKRTNFPLENLYADVDAKCHAALPGAGNGTKRGRVRGIEDKMPFVNGYAKLLLMCAGIDLRERYPRCSGDTLGASIRMKSFEDQAGRPVASYEAHAWRRVFAPI